MSASVSLGVVRQRLAATGKRRLGLSIACLGATLLSMSPTGLSAAADGPDAWNVSGIPPGQTARLHAAPSARSAVIARLRHDSTGLVNLGCKPGRAKGTIKPRDARWCRVEIDGKRGWISSRYLVEGTLAPPVIKPGRTLVAAWIVECASGECTVEQTAGVDRLATRLRIEPRPSNNARIEITRVGIPDTGALTIAMDGKLTTSGPLAQLRTGDGLRLVLTPDDITAGLLRLMARHKTMTIALPGDAAGAVFKLARFRDALDLARRHASGIGR